MLPDPNKYPLIAVSYHAARIGKMDDATLARQIEVANHCIRFALTNLEELRHRELLAMYQAERDFRAAAAATEGK